MNIHVLLLLMLSVFILTSAKTFDGKHGTKLLVVTGSVNSVDYPESEVIDLESDTGGDCHGWTEFPYGLFGGTGALFNTESTKGTEGTFLVTYIGNLFFTRYFSFRYPSPSYLWRTQIFSGIKLSIKQMLYS